MSDAILPLSSGTGTVGAVSEHYPRRDGSARQRSDDEHNPDGHPPSDRHDDQHKRHDSFPPALDDPGVPAETLFAATIIGNELAQHPPSPEELRLRNGGAWLPPDSPLHLKDKLI